MRKTVVGREGGREAFSSFPSALLIWGYPGSGTSYFLTIVFPQCSWYIYSVNILHQSVSKNSSA